MRRSVILLGLLFAGFAGGARAEQLTIALSTPEVKITSDFTGTAITIFGVIERDAATVSRPGSYGVAIAVRGPPETVVTRRKDSVLGVWINGASETMVGAPSFYALASSRPLDALAPPNLLRRFGIGFDYLRINYEGRPRTNAPAAADFRDALIRLKQKDRLYAQQIGGVTFIGDTVFRSTVTIPANVPVGRYVATVYLFAGDALLTQAEATVDITKIGFEQLMFTAAHDRAPLYGLACVALALVTGWLAGVIFRRD